MPVEIELKAWADDPQGLKDKITQFCVLQGEFDKADVYWFPQKEAFGPSHLGVRVRKERFSAQGQSSQSILATYKTKEVREGIEVNQEQEFAVSDGDAFESLLSLLGLEPGIGKHKQGWSWSHEGITIELSQVAQLGWFVELEILAQDDGGETVNTARSRLLGLLSRLGIGEDKIEGRYYTELLRAIGG